MDRVMVEAGGLDLTALQQAFLRERQPRYGAFLAFSGLVRQIGGVAPHEGNSPIVAIEYEMYHALFVQATLGLIGDVRGQLLGNLGPVTIVHREDVVPLGEPTIAVMLLAVHHEEALAAMQALLAGIREKIPFWKRLIHEDGTRNLPAPQSNGHPVTLPNHRFPH